jgi:hypothetical protein
MLGISTQITSTIMVSSFNDYASAQHSVKQHNVSCAFSGQRSALYFDTLQLIFTSLDLLAIIKIGNADS